MTCWVGKSGRNGEIKVKTDELYQSNATLSRTHFVLRESDAVPEVQECNAYVSSAV